MPQTFRPGDVVIYQRDDGRHHSRNGQRAIVDYADSFGCVHITFFSHRADPINIKLVESAPPETPQTEILRTIRRLERRQHFYQHIGKDLEAWQSLERV